MEEQNTNVQNLPSVPKGVGALIFGILSLVLCWYFMIPWVGLVLNIVALVFAIIAMGNGKKAIAEFAANPGKYKQGSLGLAKVGKILGLVGLIINIIFLILAILWSFIFAAAVSNYPY